MRTSSCHSTPSPLHLHCPSHISSRARAPCAVPQQAHRLTNVPSKYKKTPSLRRHAFFCRITTAGMTFLRSSGFPFFTVASTMSPTPADGRRFSTPLMPFTEMMYRFFAPVLSAQLMTAPTGRERVVRNLLPEAPPRPVVQQVESSGVESAVRGVNGQGKCTRDKCQGRVPQTEATPSRQPTPHMGRTPMPNGAPNAATVPPRGALPAEMRSATRTGQHIDSSRPRQNVPRFDMAAGGGGGTGQEYQRLERRKSAPRCGSGNG